MRNCKTLARDCPRLFWAGLCAAIAFGLVLSSVLWEYRISITPKLEKLSSVELLPRNGTNAYWFIAGYSTPKDTPCYRDNTFILYRDTTNKTRIYYVLATYPNGYGIEDTASSYEFPFFLPIGFPPGEWKYEVRTHYLCPPFELVSIHRTSDPIVVNIPEVAEHSEIQKSQKAKSQLTNLLQ